MRRIYLDTATLQQALCDIGRGYTLDEKVLREQVRKILRFPGKTTHPCARITKENTSTPVLNVLHGIHIGTFTDQAPWDDRRHTWEVRINGCFNNAFPGKPLYELWVQVVK